ncbi:MAG TPA: rhamnan synthesis F family protein [Sulfurovum sp.]|nr:rhamnan synthesis F family protein [Sulfurovum sp.]HQT28959.1 rhamnan synthesis F family protein [Sulfurovum sp.]
MNYKIHKIVYLHNKILKEDAVKLESSQKNIAIIIHVFYVDIWKEIKNYLCNLDIAYDIYITVPEDTSENTLVEMFENTPNIHIYMVENRGRDVLPFLQVMNIIGIENYNYICKIHTKKTGESALGNVWRKLLYFDLLGSRETVNSIINLFENDGNIGIITGKNTILDSQRYTYGNRDNIDLLASKLHITYDEPYRFPAGTMFWARSNIVAPIVNLFTNGQLDFEEEAGQKDDTLAHAVERFFGIIAQEQHQKILESPAKYSCLPDTTLNEVASLVLSQQYVGEDVFSMQKQKIFELEALAKSMRIKNRLKRIIPNEIIHLAKKIAKISKKP